MDISQIKTPKQLSVALKRIRKAKGLSQAQLANKMNMRQPTISDLENGRGTLDSFFKIIQALGASITLCDNSQRAQRKNTKINKMLDLIED